MDVGGAETQAKYGTCIDEHIMLLPIEAECVRSQDAYAPTECSVAALSSEDLMTLRLQRVEIDRHVRPFCERARQNDFSRQVTAVFEKIDDDGNGTLDIDEFGEVVRLLMGSHLKSADIAVHFAQILASSDSDVISREEFEIWWRSAEGEDEGGQLNMLDKMQQQVTSLDDASQEMEHQITRIQNLLAKE